MKRQGSETVPVVLVTVTTPSSSGTRSASRASRRNSPSSSRKRTPRCARVTSPGRGGVAASDQGASGDRVVRRPERPAQPRAAVLAADARDPGHLDHLVRGSAGAAARAAAAGRGSCPRPGGPISSRLCAPAAAISRQRRSAGWPRRSARSGRSASGAGRRLRGRHRLDRALPSSRSRVTWSTGNDLEAARPARPGAASPGATATPRMPHSRAPSAIARAPGHGPDRAVERELAGERVSIERRRAAAGRRPPAARRRSPGRSPARPCGGRPARGWR